MIFLPFIQHRPDQTLETAGPYLLPLLLQEPWAVCSALAAAFLCPSKCSYLSTSKATNSSAMLVYGITHLYLQKILCQNQKKFQ